MEQLEADYVIIGAGSAGCVLANRLSADPDIRVILLEAGGDDRLFKNISQFTANLAIHIPSGFVNTVKNPKVNWLYNTEPVPGTWGRTFVWPRGKVLGGSSSLNGMLYIRGQHADYDSWRDSGCEGWGWKDVFPYFLRAENQARGQNDWHAVGGPLDVCDVWKTNAVSDAAIDACDEAGIPRNSDINGAFQEGAGYFQSTTRDGRRVSTATAYLHPVMDRANLKVITQALASRILFKERRAIGIEYVRNGTSGRVLATREVISCGGTVNSAQILQLSGVGPAELLRALDIKVVVDSPNVGENLQDHYICQTTYRLNRGVRSLNEETRGVRLLMAILKYGMNRKSFLAGTPAHITAFAHSAPGMSRPDVQLHISPATMDIDAITQSGQLRLEATPGVTIAPCQLRPESKGSIRIRSRDPAVSPAIQPNYLDATEDRQVTVAALRLSRTVSRQPALGRLIHHELTPGPDCVSDDDLLDYARATGSTAYHPVGTCAMGSGKHDVLDAELRVRGVEGLRVVDASVMPRIPSGNTNAPTIMVAEKAADLILGIASITQ